ncbi:MAG: class I tRNA ligase family protein [Candidatus Levybacteria bacterium]|nr:class I tRNA ligase family protein [Candidatus Levybacteria bacterium]
MNKVYNHKEVEDKIYKKWEESGSFAPEANPKGNPFSIILPPPNANAPLHFGHAMYTVEDILIRYHRMKGDKSLWLPGTDHAGIETQFVFEKKLKEEGKSRLDYDRETLYKMIENYVNENRGGIERQLRRLGFSLDWSRQKYTLDPDIVRLVYKTFKKMYDDGLIYRDYRLVNYCTYDGTSFSDLEVIYEERKNPLYYIKYGPLVLATTRPETKFGDTAVAVNPADKRYKEYIGKEIEIETVIGKAKIKVIADVFVDPSFGTGVVKITPAHDFQDFDVGKRHNLPLVQVINYDGKMNEKAGKFSGLYIKQARTEVVEEMKKKGMLEKIDESYINRTPLCYKCKNPIESLPLEQWFVKVEGLKKGAIKVVKEGKIKIYPKNFESIYFQWLEGLEDWNISRQIVWGIRIPAWKCENSHWIVTEGETPKKCAKCTSKKLTQDTDTFDTWFSSGQWPYVTLKTNYSLPKMGFDEDVADQVLKGKTKTYRLRDHNFKVGDKVLFKNTQTGELFGYGIVKEAEETIIEKINYKDESHFKTYKSLDELIKALKLRNQNAKVNPKTKAYSYSYEFRPLEELENIETLFETFYPTSIMETAYDILKAWVTRMVMLGIYITGEVPFKQVLFHGLVKDPYGKKMSKSKGNVVDPLELVDEYGADSIRFALIYGNATGNDQALFYGKLQAARNFSNKLWNIARFISMKREALNPKSQIPNSLTIEQLNNLAIEKVDKEMVDKVEELIEKTTRHIEKFEFNLAAEGLYEFIWHEFADKYIEDVKKRINENSFLILNSCFMIQLALLHPFMPFITEEIFGKFSGNNRLLITEPWPLQAQKSTEKSTENTEN